MEEQLAAALMEYADPLDWCLSAFAAVALLAVVATMRIRPSSVDISLGSTPHHGRRG